MGIFSEYDEEDETFRREGAVKLKADMMFIKRSEYEAMKDRLSRLEEELYMKNSSDEFKRAEWK